MCVFCNVFIVFIPNEVTKEASYCIYWCLKIDYVIFYGQNSLDNDIIGQSVEPNKRTIEEPNELLALNLCQL